MSYPERQTCQVQVNLAAGSAGKVVAPNPFVDDATPSARIASVRFASDADLALDGTNYFTGILKDPTDTNNLFTGFGNQSEALSQGGMQVGSKVAGADVFIAKGAAAVFDVAHTGTGALCKGTLLVEYERSRAS